MVGTAGAGPQSKSPEAGAAEGPWSVEIRRDHDAFASLATDWNDLYAECAKATPFQSHAWLASWWREYGTPGRLRLVLVRRAGRLVAAAPLTLERRWPCRVLRALGGGLSDFTEVLVDDSCAEDAGQMLAKALASQPGWQVIDLREARPGGPAEHLYQAWPGAHWRVPGSLCLEVPGRSLPDLLHTLPARTAKKVRAKLRKIDALGVSTRRVDAVEVAEAVPALLRLHELQWRNRGITEEHRQPRFERHLTRAAGRLLDQGQAALFQYRLGEKLVASELVLVGHDFVGTYMVGVDPDLRQHADIATMLMSEDLAFTQQLGHPVLNMLRGDEPYKMRWQPTPVRNRRLLLAQPDRPPAAVLYALAVRTRAAAVDAARERLPWLRRARHRARKAVARLAIRRE